MTTASLPPILRFVRHLAASPDEAALSDAHLLERFAAQRDESAFTTLVRRHGPFVLGICRRVLQDRHAAEDAFQGTFIVLARKAGRIQRPETLGLWLYGVAVRTALKAKASAARRRQIEQRVAVDRTAEQPDEVVWRDLRPVLDETIAALPERYRVPFVLHHLEGATVAEVARRSGCPPGTVAAHLARAKERLRLRLSRRGVTLSAAVLTAVLSGNGVSAGVPRALTTGVVQAAMTVAVGQVTGLSAASAVLTKGVIQAMTLTKLNVAALLLAVSAVGVGVGLSWHGTRAQDGARAGRADVMAVCAVPEGAGDPGRPPVAAAPPVERCYAGGFRSLRGFAFHGQGAESSGCENSGDFQFLNSIEYQVPVRTNDQLYLMPFVDGGTVESRVDPKDDGVVAGGVGSAVPMRGPVPVALDFGFPIVKPANNCQQVFEF